MQEMEGEEPVASISEKLNQLNASALRFLLLSLIQEDEKIKLVINQKIDTMLQFAENREEKKNLQHLSNFEIQLDPNTKSKLNFRRHQRSRSTPFGISEDLIRSSKEESVEGSIMEGPLQIAVDGGKKKKKWVVLDEENLYLFEKKPDQGKPKPEMDVIKLVCSSIRLPEIENGKPKGNFKLITPGGEYKFISEIDKDAIVWANAIQDICHNLVHQTIGSEEKNLKNIANQRKDSISKAKEEANSIHNQIRKELLEIRKLPGNEICVDCGQIEPEWVSINLGIFVCIQCSGIHRNLGTHISKIRSIHYDHFEMEQIEFIREMGNKKANEIFAPKDDSANLLRIKKPGPNDSVDLKTLWIQAKYNILAFVDFKKKEEIMKQFGIISDQHRDHYFPLEHHVTSPTEKERKRHTIRSIAKTSSGFSTSSPSLFERD